MPSPNEIGIVPRDDVYVLNHCTKYLARDNADQRHNFGQFAADDERGAVCDAWRFPIVDSHFDGADQTHSYAFNEVTFVYRRRGQPVPQSVAIVGSFAALYTPLPLRPVKFSDAATDYFTLTLVVPKGEAHLYKFLVDGQAELDPINPQRVTLENGAQWSRFFTQLCTTPLSLERYELMLLKRLTDHVLPFQTEEGERFLRYFYDYLDKQPQAQFVHAYRLDYEVGVVNFIDKLLAREERHHLIDYQICLDLIDRLLRQRNPFRDVTQMGKEMYIQLYNELASGTVPGWDYSRYNNPQYFLQLLRRHTFTGAFAHPKYGGNVGGVGWAYLAERYTDKGVNLGEQRGHTLFDWRRAMEHPLGTNQDYRG